MQHADVVHVAAHRLGQGALTPHAVGVVAIFRQGTAAVPLPPTAAVSDRPEPLPRRQDGDVAARLLTISLRRRKQCQPALSVVVRDVGRRRVGDRGHGGAEKVQLMRWFTPELEAAPNSDTLVAVAHLCW